MDNVDRYNVSANLIKQTVSRIESLEKKKTEIMVDLKDTFAEAKAHGLDVAILRKLVKMRKLKKEDVEEEEELLEIYKRALEQ
jgi:uncharacterized protein (UPF0335 family)